LKLWLALPTWEREPKTLAELAKTLNVHPTTLSDWQNEKGFDEEVKALSMKWAKKFHADVLGATIRVAADFLGGTANDRKLYFQYVENWAPKEAMQHELPPGQVVFVTSSPDGRQHPPDLPQGPSNGAN